MSLNIDKAEMKNVMSGSEIRRKPTIGILPARMFYDDRYCDVRAAIERRISEKQIVPVEWWNEMKMLEEVIEEIRLKKEVHPEGGWGEQD